MTETLTNMTCFPANKSLTNEPSVYQTFCLYKGSKELQESQYPGCWKSSAAATATGIVHKPTMRVPCGVKHTALGGSGLKFGFQFGSHYIYNMRCNRKDRESRAKDKERAFPSLTYIQRNTSQETYCQNYCCYFYRDGTPLLG